MDGLTNEIYSLHAHRVRILRSQNRLEVCLREKLYAAKSGAALSFLDDLDVVEALLSYVDATISFCEIFDLKKIFFTEKCHRFLVAWRNSVHHREYIYFSPYTDRNNNTEFFLQGVAGEISKSALKSSEKCSSERERKHRIFEANLCAEFSHTNATLDQLFKEHQTLMTGAVEALIKKYKDKLIKESKSFRFANQYNAATRIHFGKDTKSLAEILSKKSEDK